MTINYDVYGIYEEVRNYYPELVSGDSEDPVRVMGVVEDIILNKCNKRKHID
jgi:hypothetical protein